MKAYKVTYKIENKKNETKPSAFVLQALFQAISILKNNKINFVQIVEINLETGKETFFSGTIYNNAEAKNKLETLIKKFPKKEIDSFLSHANAFLNNVGGTYYPIN